MFLRAYKLDSFLETLSLPKKVNLFYMLSSEYSLWFASWNGTSDVQMMTIHHSALLFPLYARMSQFDGKEMAAELQILGQHSPRLLLSLWAASVVDGRFE